MSKPPKRPRDFSQAAKFVVDVATGQIDDAEPEPTIAAKHGSVGGLKRAANLSPAQRAAVAKKAAHVRWGKGRPVRAKKERV